jgi:hypothetical protein
MYRNFCADNSNKSQLGESANRQEIRFSAMNFNKFLGFGPYQGTEAKNRKTTGSRKERPSIFRPSGRFDDSTSPLQYRELPRLRSPGVPAHAAQAFMK